MEHTRDEHGHYLFDAPSDFGVDVESAKVWYCDHFEHVGCGGAPRAYTSGNIVCTKCRYIQAVADAECLGTSLLNIAWKLKGATSVPKPVIKFVQTQPSFFS